MTNEEALLIDIKFQLDMYGSGQGSAEDTLTRVREIISSPSLNDDQQVVLEWLKDGDNSPIAMIGTLDDDFLGIDTGSLIPTKVREGFEKLTDTQQFQVLAAFAEWGLSQLNDD